MALHRFFWPRSIALIGASGTRGSLAARPLRLLQEHSYDGRLYPVNPRYEELRGIPCYSSVDDLPEVPDLVMILVNAQEVPTVVDACGSKGVKNVVVIGSGFAEQKIGGSEPRARLVEILERYPDLKLAGPNSEGFLNVPGRMPVTFSPAVELRPGESSLLSGPVAVISQSGGLGFALLDDGQARRLGFSYVVSTGNEDGLSALDYVEYLMSEASVRVIALFLEGLKNAGKLDAIAERLITTGKHLVVAKAGSSRSGGRAAQSHTAHLAGNDTIYRAAFERYGITTAIDQEQLVDSAMALAWSPLPKGNRVAVLTYSGGAGVWTADALEDSGFDVPSLSPALQERISTLIPPYGSVVNPVDVTAQVIQTAGGLAPILSILIESDEVDAVVVATTLSNARLLLREEDALQEVVGRRAKPIALYSYTRPSREASLVLARLRIPWYTSSRRAAHALKVLRDKQVFLKRHAGRSSGDAELRTRRRSRYSVEASALALNLPALEGPWPEWQIKAALRDIGLPVPYGQHVTSQPDLPLTAREVGYPVALKVQIADLDHKSDIGGVTLDLSDADEVAAAADRIISHLEASTIAPASVEWLVERMHPVGPELLVGLLRDANLGAALVIGFGGLYAETLSDTVCVLCPASSDDVRHELERLRGYTLLRGTRGQPPRDHEALVQLVVTISELVVANPRIAELEFNPIAIGEEDQGVMILDAFGRIV